MQNLTKMSVTSLLFLAAITSLRSCQPQQKSRLHKPRSTVNNCTQASIIEEEKPENELEEDALYARRERAAIVLESLDSLENLDRPAQVLEPQGQDFTSTTFTESKTCKNHLTRP